jgi:hypothetical protein
MSSTQTIENACAIAREELQKLETAALRARELRGAAHRSARAHVRSATAAIRRSLTEVVRAAREAPPPEERGPITIPDPVPDVDQDPQD